MPEGSSMGSTHGNNIARTSAGWQQPSRSVLCFLSARSGRKEEKELLPKSNCVCLKDRENIRAWNERTDVITLNTLRKGILFPCYSSSFIPTSFWLVFYIFSSPTALPWSIRLLQVIQTSSVVLLAFSKSRNSSKNQLEQPLATMQVDMKAQFSSLKEAVKLFNLLSAAGRSAAQQNPTWLNHSIPGSSTGMSCICG